MYAFTRKEAVLSAQIEGTHVISMDLLEVEVKGQTPTDAGVQKVWDDLDAFGDSRAKLGRSTGLPVIMRPLSEAPKRPLAGGRGAHKQPGDVRRSQNCIGGTRPGDAAFVPFPPHRLPELLCDFERAIRVESNLPSLVRVGLLLLQFETLHAFLDGNACLGRPLFTLLLRHFGLLSCPLRYLSLPL